VIAGQPQRRRQAGQVLEPVATLRLEGGAGQPLALPGRVVRVLERELGQGRRVAAGECLVERAQLVRQDAERRAIADDVMEA
jgi:hypothetical protein